MDNYRKFVKKRYSFMVTASNALSPQKFELDKNVKLVKELLMSSGNPNLLFYRGSQRIEINGEEIYPDGFESRLLMSGISVPPDQKFASLGEAVVAGNGEIKLQYMDTDNPSAPFQPYEVSLYLTCELE